MLKHIPFYASLLGRELANGKKSSNCHVLVYGAIEAHSMGDKGCIASNKLIASETGLKLATVQVVISVMTKSGWLEIQMDEQNHRVRIDPILVITPPIIPIMPPHNPDYAPPYLGLKESANLTDENESLDTVREHIDNTHTFSDDEEKKNSAKRKEAVLERAIQIINPREKPTASRLAMLNARLKDGYSYTDILNAATMLAKSKWHKENKQMSIDNLLAPSKFGRWYAQVSDLATTSNFTPSMTLQERMAADKKKADEEQEKYRKEWGIE